MTFSMQQKQNLSTENITTDEYDDAVKTLFTNIITSAMHLSQQPKELMIRTISGSDGITDDILIDEAYDMIAEKNA